MYRSRLSALATLGMVGCSVLLAEDPAQCTRDADCAALGFTGSTCDSSGVCTAPVNGGSGGGGGTTTAGTSGSTSDGGNGNGGTSVANGGEGNSTAGTGVEVNGGEAGMGGSLGGGGSGSSPPTTPSVVRLIGDSLTQTAGGAALAYLDTCPEDQVLIGINGWSQPDASPSWLMRGQAVCGKIVLTHGGPGGAAGAGGAGGAAGASDAADGPLTVTIEAGAVLYERGIGLVDDVQGAAMCDPNEVVVGFDGRSGAFMDRVRVYCAPLVVTGGPGTYALEFGDLPTPRGSVGASAGGGAFSLLDCPPGQVARGAQIQAGAHFDAFGLVCGKPELAYPVGAACTKDADCDTANCDTDVCATVTCGELVGGAGGAGGAGSGVTVNCTCALLDTRQYLFCDGSPTWTEALDACADRGMQLVRVNEGSENGWLRSTASLRALGSIWLGGTDAVTEGDWLWSDGTMFWQGAWDTGGPVGGLYNLWAGAQPDNASALEHCAEMYPDSRWNDNMCAQMRDFVCEPP